MKNYYLCDSFDLKQLERERYGQAVNFVPLSPAAVSSIIVKGNWESAIEDDTILSLIEITLSDGGVRQPPTIPTNRTSVILDRNHHIIVAVRYDHHVEFWEVFRG